MKILVLGGTQFLGRHFVEAARAHELTLFNRGQTNPDLFPDVKKICGDRTVSLDALRGRRWDAVLDTCGFRPEPVRASVEAIDAARYVFISTCSVYPEWRGDETTPIRGDGDDYGSLKAMCERVLPADALVVRPGLIAGPHDPSDRFTYWPARIARGGRGLAPGRRDRLVQFIDVRDLAAWLVRTIETRASGVYNATGPGVTMKDFLMTCAGVCGGTMAMSWVGDEALRKAGVEPYTEMPLWIPGVDDAFDIKKAVAAGLTFRTIDETIRDTLAWDRTRAPDAPRKAGLSRQRERELLEAR